MEESRSNSSCSESSSYMKSADCEICGAECTACSVYDSSAQLHAKGCPLGIPPSKCLKNEVANVLNSAPFDVDLRNTSRHRIPVSQDIENYLEKDKPQYMNNDDFDLAPMDPFDSCQHDNVAAVKMYIDSTGSIRLTRYAMLEEARRRRRPLSDPLYPRFKDLIERKSTFDPGRYFENIGPEDASQAIERYATNGFYVNDQGCVACFHCGISFIWGIWDDSSWIIEREHARWSPYCAHLLYRNGRDFVKVVLEDTRRIHMERNGYLERLEPETIQTLVKEGYDEGKIRMFVSLIHERTGWYPDRHAILRGIQ